MSETRVSEIKQDGPEKVRKVTRNRKSYGQIRYYNKCAVYWTCRSADQIHRLSNSWLVEADTISAVKLYGISHVGIELDDGTKLLTKIATFGPEGKERGVRCERSNTYVDPWGNRGAMCWHIPVSLWAVQLPPEDVRQQTLLGQMRIKRSRAPARLT